MTNVNNSNTNLPGAMICYKCANPITSQYHRSSCNTVFMFGFKKTNYSNPDFKPMMTYGLGGCTALVMINRTTNEIFFGHHPDFDQTIVWFNDNYNQSNQFDVIVKSPGEWVKTNDQWKMVSKSQQQIISTFTKPNINLILEPYSLNQSHDNDFESTLYVFKQSNNIVYTDNYGREITLIKKTD